MSSTSSARLTRLTAGLVAAVLVLGGCSVTGSSTTDAPAGEAPGDRTSAATEAETPESPPDPGPTPEVGECHAISFRQAVSAIGRTDPVACRREHTAQTFFVGRVRGDLGSARAQRRIREACTSRLPAHLGRTPRELRLGMAQAVWFTPSPRRAEAGADWFRCDVVVVARPRTLLPLPRRTKGWGAGEAPALQMCATAAPGSPGFTRVTCAADHAWVAVASVDLPGKRLPKAAQVADRMDPTCRDAARARTEELDFSWTQEGPTRERWDAGLRYGICWVPD